jgi:hypothetical protein
MARRRKHPPPTMHNRVVLFLRLYEQMKANPFGREQKITLRVTFGGPEQGAEVLGVDKHPFESYLARFRQLIMPGDPVYLGVLLSLLPGHVADDGLRQRLAAARHEWKAAQGVIVSKYAPMMLGRSAAGYEVARLYLYGSGLMHSDPELAPIWERLDEMKRQLITWQFHHYEARVRKVANDLHHILREAAKGGHWRDDPIDLSA